jgi:hypothetical protein
MRSGSALFEERKGGRMRLKPRAIWGLLRVSMKVLSVGMPEVDSLHLTHTAL